VRQAPVGFLARGSRRNGVRRGEDRITQAKINRARVAVGGIKEVLPGAAVLADPAEVQVVDALPQRVGDRIQFGLARLDGTKTL
jgi:hypothetical protein